MSDKIQDFEAVSVYPLDPDVLEELLSRRNECVFMWSTKDGWPVGVVMSYLWKNGRFWLTLGAHRHRVAAIRRDPRVCISVSNGGRQFGEAGGRTATVKGHAIVHEDRETKDWFYPEFSRHLHPDHAQAERFQQMLDSPIRVVIEVVPEKWITYDGVKMAMDAAGKLPADARGPRLSADTERLQREVERRGLT